MTISKLLSISFALLLAACTTGKEVEIIVTNPSDLVREGEIVEVDFNTVSNHLALAEGETIVVTDSKGTQLPYQITTDRTLLFPTSVAENGTAAYTIRIGTPQPFTSLASGRFVPERKDDYAWENNRVAFRVYGPALKPIDGPSNGVDVWSKRTEAPVIDLWYKRNAEGKDYHNDRGEGLDCYKVGRTLGGGMPAPLHADTLCLGENFVTAETVENGPLRTQVKLTYAPLKVGDTEVVETRIITLDANTSFCKMEVTYSGPFATLPLVAGLTLHDNKGAKTVFTDEAAVSYWEKQDKEYGTIGTALVFEDNTFERDAEINHHLCILSTCEADKPFIYYFGACWDKFIFTTQDAWEKEVKAQSDRINNPLRVSL